MALSNHGSFLGYTIWGAYYTSDTQEDQVFKHPEPQRVEYKAAGNDQVHGQNLFHHVGSRSHRLRYFP